MATYNGTEGNDTIIGTSNADTIDGGLGNDTLNGGAGNDTYILWTGIGSGTGSGVDTIVDTDGGTDTLQLRIFENAGFDLYRQGGILKIRNTAGEVSTLGSGTTVEQITLMSMDPEDLWSWNLNLATSLTGSTGDDWVVGTAAGESLAGAGGNDFLQGDAGNDSLSGGAGNDVLVGGAGNDTLNGGAGNDTYILWTGIGSGTGSGVDTIVDTDGGTDTLQLRIFENAGFDLYRQGGILKIRNTAGEVSTLGSGTTVEQITLMSMDPEDLWSWNLNLATSLTGSTGDDWVVGTAAGESLAGAGGNDFLQGDAGNDSLSGGAGSDFFDFTTVLNGTTNVDTITDFNRADDFIRLDNAVMAGLGATTGALTAAAFVSGASRITAADTSDRVIYNTTTGDLYYDADGTGSSTAIKIALIGISTHPVLDHTDFLII